MNVPVNCVELMLFMSWILLLSGLFSPVCMCKPAIIIYGAIVT
jgi:hypothetical protein